MYSYLPHLHWQSLMSECYQVFLKKALDKYDHEQEIIKELEAGKTTLEIYGFDKIIENKKCS